MSKNRIRPPLLSNCGRSVGGDGTGRAEAPGAMSRVEADPSRKEGEPIHRHVLEAGEALNALSSGQIGAPR